MMTTLPAPRDGARRVSPDAVASIMTTTKTTPSAGQPSRPISNTGSRKVPLSCPHGLPLAPSSLTVSPSSRAHSSGPLPMIQLPTDLSGCARAWPMMVKLPVPVSREALATVADEIGVSLRTLAPLVLRLAELHKRGVIPTGQWSRDRADGLSPRDAEAQDVWSRARAVALADPKALANTCEAFAAAAGLPMWRARQVHPRLKGFAAMGLEAPESWKVAADVELAGPPPKRRLLSKCPASKPLSAPERAEAEAAEALRDQQLDSLLRQIVSQAALKPTQGDDQAERKLVPREGVRRRTFTLSSSTSDHLAPQGVRAASQDRASLMAEMAVRLRGSTKE